MHTNCGKCALRVNCGDNPNCACKSKAKAHQIIANLDSSDMRFETHDGEQFLIVPIVMARAGVVMNGSLTVIEEMTPEGWNGRPVTIGHPMKEGAFHTANAPDIISDWVVGQLFNSRLDGDALKADAWINVQKIRKLRPGLIASLRNGENMDVSTGFFANDEESKGVSNGREYVVISRNWIPDHLALLPDEPGACGWDDGCGVRSNSDRRLRMKLKSKVNKAVERILAAVGGNSKDAETKIRQEVAALFTNERGADDDSRQIIADLISNDGSPFLPDDEDSLKMMSPDTLKKMREQYLTSADEATDEEVDPEDDSEGEKPTDNEEGCEDDEEEVVVQAEDEEKKDKKAMAKKNSDAVLVTKAELATIVAAEVKKATSGILTNTDRDALSAAKKLVKSHRSGLLDKIKTNSDIPEATLNAMDTPTLEAVAKGLRAPADYSGRMFANASFEDADADTLKGMMPPSSKDMILNARKQKEKA